MLIFLDSLAYRLTVLSLLRFTFQLKSGRKYNISNGASLCISVTKTSAGNESISGAFREQMQTTTTTDDESKCTQRQP